MYKTRESAVPEVKDELLAKHGGTSGNEMGKTGGSRNEEINVNGQLVRRYAGSVSCFNDTWRLAR